MQNTLTLEVRDQQLELLPAKAVWWAAERTLFVADTHFGKAATFRRFGIPVPGGTTAVMLHRLSQLIENYGASRLVVLGDFVHSYRGRDASYEADLIAWRQQHSQLQLSLVAGNHDRGHDGLFAAMKMELLEEPAPHGPFAFCHFHQANEEDGRFALAGHIHPGVRLPGSAAGEKIPCFWVTEEFMVLPAFGEFTGCETVRPAADDRVFAVADGEVTQLPQIVVSNGRR